MFSGTAKSIFDTLELASTKLSFQEKVDELVKLEKLLSFGPDFDLEFRKIVFWPFVKGDLDVNAAMVIAFTQIGRLTEYALDAFCSFMQISRSTVTQDDFEQNSFSAQVHYGDAHLNSVIGHYFPL
ncbi:hypothetical protein RUK98_003403 [Vibrio cholerae]|uniref:hypothetical protein n=1 Tax=Vibrio anguillarum TaxID=55601 RepID=UPI0028DABC95|nr:hypothetical protein [Vibrio cholerae]